VLSESRRFNVLCCGRRWGKSKLGLVQAARAALNGQPAGWFSPTYRMLSEVWREATQRLVDVTREQSVQERRLVLITGGTLDFWSLDRPDVARGRKYQRIVVDEAAIVPDLDRAWQAVLRPTLVDLRGDAWFLSTPQGFNEFHTLWSYGQDMERTDWASWRMPTSRNPWIPPDELVEARSSMDAATYAQEFEASFQSRTGLVYYQFSRAGNVAPVADTGGEVLVGMDFNVDPMSAVVCTRAGDELHVIAEIELRDSGTEEMCQELLRRYAGRAVRVYPDPSGKSRKTSAPVGQTDFTMLKRAGFSVHAPAAAPPIVDRVNEVNAMLCNAKGRRRLFVAPACKRTIACLEQLAYKPDTSVIDKSRGLDHLPDALGYLTHMEFPLREPGRTVEAVWG